MVLWDGKDGASLIDAGYPGQMADIERALGEAGVKLGEVKRILLTHQDLDHIRSAEALAAATGAEVFAHAADTPYIQGEKRLVKMDPARFEERLKGLPEKLRDQARLMISSLPTVVCYHGGYYDRAPEARIRQLAGMSEV